MRLGPLAWRDPASFGKTGTLTGVLRSGETLNAIFTRDVDTGDAENPIITGKIVLVPEPSTALLLASGLAALAVRRRGRGARTRPQLARIPGMLEVDRPRSTVGG